MVKILIGLIVGVAGVLAVQHVGTDTIVDKVKAAANGVRVKVEAKAKPFQFDECEREFNADTNCLQKFSAKECVLQLKDRCGVDPRVSQVSVRQ